MLYLVHSGSCGNLSHGVCPHATLMTTTTPEIQWTMANTVAFERFVTTLSTRDACVEIENMWSRVLCFWFTLPVSTVRILIDFQETRACVGAHVQSYGCVALAK